MTKWLFGRAPAWAAIAALIVTAPAVLAQQAPERGRVAAAPTAPAAVESGVPAPFRIGPEDLLDISVWNNEAASRVVPVRPDGKISLPLLADVDAAGLTPVELSDVLRRRLAEYVRAPSVSVVVREVHSVKVSVLGEVKTPGRYEFKSRATVVDAIALAGGFSDFALRTRILIVRQSGGRVHKTVFNYTKFVSSEQTPESPALEPGDVIVVP